MWLSAFALTRLTAAVEARIAALVKSATAERRVCAFEPAGASNEVRDHKPPGEEPIEMKEQSGRAPARRIADPSHVFDSGLEGNTRSAIDVHEGKEVEAAAFGAFIKAAVAHNVSFAQRGFGAVRATVSPP